MIEFQFTYIFLILPLPLLTWLLLPPYRESQESVRVPFFEHLTLQTRQKPTKGAVVLKRNILQRVIAPAVWLLLMTALARPVFVEPPIERIKSGRDLLLVVDLSGSMDTRDMFDEDGKRINRLQAIKNVLGDFITRRKGDRIALMFFGTSPYLQAPFTQDSSLIKSLLEEAQVAMAGPQTMLGDAIGLAIKTFEHSEAREKVVILLTDGNDTNSKVPPEKAAELAAYHHIKIHTIGFGDPTNSGEDLFDEQMLKDIAGITSGMSFMAANRDALEEVYRQLDKIEVQNYETLSYRPMRPLYMWPLAGAFIILIFYHIFMGLRTWFSRMRAQNV
ncbi:MAG TPA: VWA domain-containing protein [Caldithrix abyssi]|uniref:VWA domain-containing protein n=1 Tax=Caldithrix abyssi TaxID=187145 RepID=A0A7V4TZ31_CALAY|nr:VWA domain-containing protein [Caldithrix abyssi]